MNLETFFSELNSTPYTAQSDSVVIDWLSDEVTQVAADCQILSTDSAGNIRVRQRAMMVDAVNGNNRIYPRSVVIDAIKGAVELARNGVMTSEMRHPEVVSGRDGEDKYVDNHDLKTATVDDIHMPDDEGWVWIDRTIRNTPHGRVIADAIRKGKPYGISTRFKMDGRKAMVDGKPVTIATKMDIHTWDDVENPAVKRAGEFKLLTDEQMLDLNLASVSDSKSSSANSQSNNNKSSDKDTSVHARQNKSCIINKEDRRIMIHPKVQKPLNTLIATIAAQEPNVKKVLSLRKLVGDAMKEVAEEDEDGDTDMSDAADAIAKADAQMEKYGYRPGAEAPSFTLAGKSASPGEPGFAPDLEGKGASAAPTTVHEVGSTLNADAQKWLEAQMKADEEEAKEKEVNEKMDKAEAESDALKAFDVKQKAYLISNAKSKLRLVPSSDAAEILKSEIDALAPIVAQQKLADKGYVAGDSAQRGLAASDAANPVGQYTERPAVWMEGVDKIGAACDDQRRRADGSFNPESMKKRREYNKKNFINPLINEIARQKHGAKSAQDWFAQSDGLMSKGERAFCDSQAAVDNTTVASLYMQPTFFSAFLTQQFQDLQALQFVEGIGPAGDKGDGLGGWTPMPSNDGRTGVAFRIPIETYVQPTGSGNSGLYWDESLLVGENAGIDEGGVQTMWLTFGPAVRKVGMSVSKEAVKFIGNGELNYPLVARNLNGICQDKARRIDRALLNEMVTAAEIYGAVSVTGESPSLTNNSVYLAGGGITVNLNPAKTAAATVVPATDGSVTYGSGIAAAIRILGPNTGTYCQTPTGAAPIVAPYSSVSVDVNGVVSNPVQFPLTVTAPAAQIEGYLSSDMSSIVNKNGVTGTATFAVDYTAGVIVFAVGAAGLTGASGLITSAVTVSYSYATNYDEFVVNNYSSLVQTGEVESMYFRRLLTKLDQTASTMASSPRFVRPNTVLSSLNAANYFVKASIFDENQSPKGNQLYPTEDYYFERNGMMGARINAPWRARDNRALVLRKNSTKYAVDTPFELEGPIQKYTTDGTGRAIDAKLYYGTEISTIFTPVVTTQSGTKLNPPSRMLLLRQTTTGG